jgi:hypothetical protein
MYSPATKIEGRLIQPELGNVSYLTNQYLRNHEGDFRDSRLSSKLASMSIDELILLPEETSDICLEGTEANDVQHFVHLTEIPELRAGRQASHNNVRFGQLHITGNQTHPLSELVAVKYLPRPLVSRELGAAIAINNRLGRTASFQPIDFTKQPNTQQIGYITKYEHGVNTLDNVLWNKNTNHALREEAMGFAGLWLANLHNHSFIHGDAQAKNIAYDSSQNTRYIDLESAKPFDPRNPVSRIERLVDVSDVFNQTFMPPTTSAENSIFINSYLDNQIMSPDYPNSVNEDDIRSIIAQANHTA